ncbi:ABC transporter substrate-binding protein [Frankia tisae]|uniref:ABC transporter substrate-binding protein n=1 Tax=Frankia tisae TaxID=2950104 RepID=UPI0021BE3B6F|nr:ABC transporter substrate-binding protein [Frankia tisae]
MSSTTRKPWRLARGTSAVVIAALTAVLAACGSSGGASASGGGSSPAAGGGSVRASGGVDLSGVNLKISYQTAEFPALLKASGLFSNLPYKYEVPIINGPANQLAALYGSQIDVGEAGDNTGAFEVANATTDWAKTGPPIQSFAIVYTPKAPHPSPAVFVTKSSGIKTLADLKGKKIGYNYGGNIYAGYVALLAQAGLSPKDVKPVQFPANQAAANAFNAGDLDAVVSSYSVVQKPVDSGQATQIADPHSLGIIGGGGWIARTSVLKDPVKLAAIKDFFTRLRTFYEQWVPAHEDAYEHVLETVSNQTPKIAKINYENAKYTTFYKIGSPQFSKIQQEIVDGAYKIGGLKSDADGKIGYTTEFDGILTSSG